MTHNNTRRQTTRIVATNSFWYAVETSFGFVMVFAVSIPMARVIGPERLGYFNYIMWLTAMGGMVGGLGLPGTAGRFMAECFGKGEAAIARGIYRVALRLQTTLAVCITVAGIALLLALGDPRYQLTSAIQIASLLPMMVSHVPSQANVANESMKTNVPASIASNLVLLVAVTLSLWLGWDLLGVACGIFLSRTADMVMRIVLTERWLAVMPAAALSAELKRRMARFAAQQVYIMLLAAVIWDKSDVVLLKTFSPDLRQITFFTLAFNLVDKAVLLPEVVASALTASILVQQGHNSSQVSRMVSEYARYMFLLAVPLFFGLLLISGPLVLVLYGSQYREAIPVLAVAAGFGVIKPLLRPMEAVFRATAQQKQMLVWTTACAFLNVGIDWVLIPRLGAVGAALGNGSTQAILIAGYWIIGLVWFGTRLDWAAIMKISVAGAMMAPPVLLISRILPPIPALPIGVIVGAVTYISMLRVARVLNAADAKRMDELQIMLPRLFRPFVRHFVHFVAPRTAVAS